MGDGGGDAAADRAVCAGVPGLVEILYWLFVQQSAWWAGGISLYMTWMMGNKKWWAPFLGLLGQFFWLLLALFTQQHGLIITVVLYTIVHGRNALKWWREREPKSIPNPYPVGVQR